MGSEAVTAHQATSEGQRGMTCGGTLGILQMFPRSPLVGTIRKWTGPVLQFNGKPFGVSYD